MNHARIAAIFLTLIFCTVALAEETITVTTLQDVTDVSGDQQVNDLPGPDGQVSFREAVTAANKTAGPQTIVFSIPPSTFWLTPGVAVLRLEHGAFVLTDGATTVDFSTQTTNMGDTNPNGPEVAIYGLEPNGWGSPAIIINANDCIIKGLGDVHQRGYAVQIAGNRNRVIGCQTTGPWHQAISVRGYFHGAPATNNIIGGTNAGEGNVLSGVAIDPPSANNIVIGNPYIRGVQVRGAPQYGDSTFNTRIGGPSLAERNVIGGVGFFGEEGFPVGTQIEVTDADGTVIEGNIIGMKENKREPFSPQIGPYGVEVRDARGTTIRGNWIAGLRIEGRNHYAGQVFGRAISVNVTNFDIRDTVIEDNIIGLAGDRKTPVPTYSGIIVRPSSTHFRTYNTRIANNQIGGVETVGIHVTQSESGVQITGNSIHDSGDLGIDLSDNFRHETDGPTLNDSGDGDTGGNNLQNYPVLSSVEADGSSTTFRGTLDSTPSSQFRIEFFASPACNPSGYGEGKTYLGHTNVATDASGNATFSATLAVSVDPGEIITSTATNLGTRDTSEFSLCLAAVPFGIPVAIANATPTNGDAPLHVQFSSEGSNDPNGTITKYFWDFGDGATSTLANPTHVYGPGQFTASLTVTDNQGHASPRDHVSILSKDQMRVSEIRMSGALVSSTAARSMAVVTIVDSKGNPLPGVVVTGRWTQATGSMVITKQMMTNAKGFAIFHVAGVIAKFRMTVTNTVRAGYTWDTANSVPYGEWTPDDHKAPIRFPD